MEALPYFSSLSLSFLGRPTARRRAEKLARNTRHVELSQDPQFQNEFAEAMIFPSGD